MADIVDVLAALSMPVKIAWIVWLAWGAAQIVWYRQQRVEIVVKALPMPRPRTRAPRKVAQEPAPEAADPAAPVEITSV
jgi:hypothetical protein